VELPKRIQDMPEGPEREAAEIAFIESESARQRDMEPFRAFMQQMKDGSQTQTEEAQIKAIVSEAAEIAPLAIPSTLAALATIHAMSSDDPIDVPALALKAQNQTLNAFESALAAEQPAVIELVLAAIPKLLEKKSPAIARLQQLFLNAEAAARGGGGAPPAPKPPVDPKRGAPTFDDYVAGRVNADGTWKQ
jgi:hypothetical protein